MGVCIDDITKSRNKIPLRQRCLDRATGARATERRRERKIQPQGSSEVMCFLLESIGTWDIEIGIVEAIAEDEEED